MVLYLDDFLINSKTVEEHVKYRTLGLANKGEETLHITWKVYVFAKKKKCLGLAISKKGISVSVEKVRIVQEWPTPETTVWITGIYGATSALPKIRS